MPKTSRQDFEALVRRAGLTLTPEQIEEMHTGWAYVEPMLERIRTHGRGREAEPALTFDPAGFGTEAH
ncbi:MAG TPA: hypothetical protein VHS58_04720 [Acetobacteraceae bacterium]|nr:hypothetical protein [Acetobacteraceae bacterium]